MNRTKHPLRGYSPSTTADSLSTFAADASPSPRTPPPPARLSRLWHALVAKSLVETLFVVALVVYFSYTSFNPYFRGSVDTADGRTVGGWVIDAAAPGERVEVQLYVDGHFVSRRLADAPRPDVFEAGRSLDPYHGFVFNLPPLPPNRTYEARVYAMYTAGGGTHRTLQEFGRAKQFSVTADGTNSAVPEAWWESGERP